MLELIADVWLRWIEVGAPRPLDWLSITWAAGPEVEPAQARSSYSPWRVPCKTNCFYGYDNQKYCSASLILHSDYLASWDQIFSPSKIDGRRGFKAHPTLCEAERAPLCPPGVFREQLSTRPGHRRRNVRASLNAWISWRPTWQPRWISTPWPEELQAIG